MRFVRHFIVSGALLGAFALAAQIQSQKRAVAQMVPQNDPSVVNSLPSPPSPNGATGAPLSSQIIAAPLTKPRPTPTTAPVWTPRFLGQTVIRVGLSTAGAPVKIYFPGGATLFEDKKFALNVEAGDSITLALNDQGGSISVEMAQGIKSGWNEVYMAVAGDPVRVTTNGSSPRWGRPYRGDLDVFPQKLAEPFKRKGPLALVNVVPLEAYLKGVVPWEMGPDAPLEALKAQAICARTKTLDFVQTKKFSAGDFDICDYDACQGYPGTENEKPRTTLAVEQTKGLAIYLHGRPIDAVYSTNSGGITAAGRDVWKGTTPIPYLQSVPDFPSSSPIAALWKHGMTEADWAKFCSNDWPSYARPDGVSSSRYEARKYRWTQFVSMEEANTAFKSDGILRVMNIQVAERTASGRIRRVRVTGVDEARWRAMPTPPPAPASDINGGVSILSASLPTKTVDFEGDGKIRAMFSKRLGSTTALPSSLFVITPQVDATGEVTGWSLQGAGWGHGVGMCQRGAQNHALEGWDARRILNWYYRGVQILPMS